MYVYKTVPILMPAWGKQYVCSTYISNGDCEKEYNTILHFIDFPSTLTIFIWVTRAFRYYSISYENL